MKTNLNESLPLHEWQKKELERRLSEYEKGGVEVIDASKVYENLRNLCIDRRQPCPIVD